MFAFGFGFLLVIAAILGAVAAAKERARKNRVRLLRHDLGGDSDVEVVGSRSSSPDRIGIATLPPLRSASLFVDKGAFSLSAVGPSVVVAVDDDALLAAGDGDHIAELAAAFIEAGGDVSLSSAPGAVHARITRWKDVDGRAMKARLLSFVALVDALAARAPAAASPRSSSGAPAGAPSGEPMAVPR